VGCLLVWVGWLVSGRCCRRSAHTR
jgi:hypothetical protein